MLKTIKKVIVSGVTLAVVLSSGLTINIGKIFALNNTNDEFTIVNDQGDVTFVPYNSDYNIEQNETGVELNNPIIHKASAAFPDLAILPTGVINYTEYDGTASGRSGYTNGSSSNYAAFVGYINSSNGLTTTVTKKARIKQSGVFMDIDLTKYPVDLVHHSSVSQLDYYDVDNDSKGNTYLYHSYYYTSGSSRKGTWNIVGKVPTYIKSGKKYYSFDGIYFYDSYDSMIADYRAGCYTHTKAVNSTSPYYNYFQYLSLRAPSNYTATEFNNYLYDKITTAKKTTDSVMIGMGQAAINVQNKYGINALITIADAALESGWGTSKYARERNNIFGLAAYDSNPDKANKYDTIEKCVETFAYDYISSQYFNESNYKYRGPHEGNKCSGINVKYCSTPMKGEQVANICYIIDTALNNKDANYYSLAVSEINDINYYADAAFSKKLYVSGPNDSKNYKTRNSPITIISKSTNGYKVFSDTPLNNTRTGVNGKTAYVFSRDYAYVKSSGLSLPTAAKNINVNLTTLTKCTHATSKVVGKVAGTCTTAGYTGDTCCAKCGAILARGKASETNPSGHAYVYKTIKYATFTTNGTAIKTCSNAGCDYKSEEFVTYSPKTFKLSATSYTYNGTARKPAVTIYTTKDQAIGTKYYTCTYSNNVNAGTATVKVTFKDIWQGSKSLTYKINKATYKETAKGYTGTYDGKSHTITLSGVKSGSSIRYKTKKAQTTYDKTTKPTRTSVGRTNVYYRITNPNYTTIERMASILINPKGTSISSLTAYSKAFTVKWNKQATQTTGYYIQYSTSSSFSNPTTVAVTSTSTVSKKITKLSAKKKYYVRIRTYKTVDGTKYFSGWSSTKYITTK